MKSWIMPLACCLFFLSLFVCFNSAHAAKYALLIGINEYDGVTFDSLDGCRNDVTLMQQVLRSPRFGYPTENITTLVDAGATHSNILNALYHLAEKAEKGDEVYIHYSGHGSTTHDLNGDEKSTGLDSTLVSYGSRSGSEVTGPSSDENARSQTELGASSTNLDDFDILDDQLEHALSRLSSACDTVIFVADACHSGTITRGDNAMKTRGIATDTRPHPEGFLSPLPLSAGRGWVGIGAASVHEKAVEYKSDGNTPHGAFTWFWARSLLQSNAEDSWLTVFNRTKALMRAEQIHQTPQVEGNAAKPLFGGGIAPELAFTVMSLYPDGDKAIINIGSLAGITMGSVFRAGPEDAPTALLTVYEVNPTDCEATLDSGQVALGDTLSLHTWSAPEFVLKAYFRADLPDDAPLLSGLTTKLLKNFPAVEQIDDPTKANMVVWILRPEKNADGSYVHTQGSFLPMANATAQPEVWVLDPSETSFYGAQDRLRASLTDEGITSLKANLSRLARMRAMLAMPGPVTGKSPVEFSYHIYAPCLEGTFKATPPAERMELSDGSQWKRSRIVPVNGHELDLQGQEQLILVEAKNTTSATYYVYGINIMENAAISAFLPGSAHQFLTDVPPHQSRFFDESGLLLTDPKEHVRLMASKRQMDVSFLEQTELQRTRSKGSDNPIEVFLETQLFPRTRGITMGTSLNPSSWATVQTSIHLGK